MNHKPPLMILNVSNPAGVAGKGSFVILECEDEARALSAAQKIALQTGRSVTVRDEVGRVIGTTPAPIIH